MNQAIKILGIGAIVWLILQNIGVNIARKITVGQVHLRNFQLIAGGITFKLFVEIKNSSQVTLPVEGFNGFVKYGDIALTNITLQNPEVIAANSVVDIPFNINIPFNELSSALIAVFQSGNGLNDLYLEGTLFSNGIKIPVYKSILSI